MIEEQAVVTAIDGRYAWVQTQRQSACDSCSAQKGCGTSTIGKVIGKQYTQVKAINDCNAAVGDTVQVALAEDMLLKGSFAVYFVPLLLMMFFAVVGDKFFIDTIWGAPLGALSGLGVGFVWLKYYSTKMASNRRFQPVAQRVLQSGKLKVTAVYTP